MSRIEVAQLELLTAKTNAQSAALKAADGNVDDEAYVKSARVAEKIYKSGMKRLRGEAAQEKEATAHQKSLDSLDMLNLEYSKVYNFESLTAANIALRALATDWVTPASGRRGGNKWRKYHGGPRGCFLIIGNKTTGKATLCAANSNVKDLPDPMMGGTPVTEDANTDEEEDVTSNLGEIAVLFACGGKTLVEMKAMDSEEQKVHLAKLMKDRGIKAARVSDVAAAASCPSEHGTRDKRIEWLFNYILEH